MTHKLPAPTLSSPDPVLLEEVLGQVVELPQVQGSLARPILHLPNQSAHSLSLPLVLLGNPNPREPLFFSDA